MKLDTFKKASTFSWIGRHALELRYLLATMRTPPENVLDAGSGCFEPVYLAQMLPGQSDVYAVEANGDIAGVLNKIIRSGSIELVGLDTLLCNKDDSGAPIPNNDLTNAVLLATGLRELESAGFNYEEFYKNKKFSRPLGGAGIHILNEDVIEYAQKHQREFDFIYEGALFVNLLKGKNYEEAFLMTKKFVGMLEEGAVLGSGSVPSAIYGPTSLPVILNKTEAMISDIIVDNLVMVNGALRGGYCIRAVRTHKDTRSESLVQEEVIEEGISKDTLLGNADIRKSKMGRDEFFNNLKAESEYLLLAALKRNGEYFMFEAPRKQLSEIIPAVRKQLSLIKAAYEFVAQDSFDKNHSDGQDEQ
jgi:hypothetical protein